MKRNLISIAAALGFSIASSTILPGQSLPAHYNVPFSFNAAGVQMSSGKYTVSNAGPQVSTLRGYKNSVLFIRRPELTGKAGKAHLTFHRYGDAYFLREVWQENGIGNQIKVSEQEREMIRAEQQAKAEVTTVLVAASN